MSKSFSFPNVGTCSKQTNIVLNDPYGGHYLRPPSHQLPGSDCQESEKGSDRDVISNFHQCMDALCTCCMVRFLLLRQE